jgi:GTPase SAR1 family protein
MINGVLGQERFKVMTKSYYRGARACCIVYDITRRVSFKNVETWAEQYTNHNAVKSKHIIVIIGTLINSMSKSLHYFSLSKGNKADLNQERQVQAYEGEEIARKLGMISLVFINWFSEFTVIRRIFLRMQCKRRWRNNS